MVSFRDAWGRSLGTPRLPPTVADGVFGGIVWEADDLGIVLFVDGTLCFADVRPAYAAAATAGRTLVWAAGAAAAAADVAAAWAATGDLDGRAWRDGCEGPGCGRLWQRRWRRRCRSSGGTARRGGGVSRYKHERTVRRSAARARFDLI
jgi:hypothetical protein